jgi:hypothetical protein
MPVPVRQIRELLVLPENKRDAPAACSRALSAYKALEKKARQIYGRHDFPCPKPVGQLILGLPFMREGEGGKISLREGEAETYSLLAENGNKKIVLKMYVHAMQNLIILEGNGTGLDKGDFWVRIYRHWDTIKPGGKVHPTSGNRFSLRDFERMVPPRSFQKKEVFGIIQDFPAEMTFPEGFRCVLAGTIQGASAEYQLDNETFKLGTPMIAEQEGRISHMITKRFTPINKASGAAATAHLGPLHGAFRIMATAFTTQDDVHPETAAVRALFRAQEILAQALRRAHTGRLDDFCNGKAKTLQGVPGEHQLDNGMFNQGTPMIADYKPRHVGLSCVASSKFCFQDSAPWHGDFHFNNGPQGIPAPRKDYTSSEPFFQLIETMLPMAKRNARNIYGCSGAAYPLVHFPLKAKAFLRILPWDDSIELSGGIMRQVWKRFLYTWDMEYLKKRGYPLMREVARFYANYVTKEEDGAYHVVPTVSSEHWGYTVNFERNRDSNAALSMIMCHLRASVRAATLLGVDKEARKNWEEIAGRMPPYPLYQTSEGPIFVDVAGAPPIKYNIAANLACVWLGGDVGLDSSPEMLKIARRTYQRIKTDKPHGDGYKRQIAPRLGIYYAKRGIARENLLQSHTGVIRVFPAVPRKGHQEFQDYLAEGAFEVSARWEDGLVTHLTIHSSAGQDCPLANPWSGKGIRVLDVSTGEEVGITAWSKYDNEYISFETLSGSAYKVEPKP